MDFSVRIDPIAGCETFLGDVFFELVIHLNKISKKYYDRDLSDFLGVDGSLNFNLFMLVSIFMLHFLISQKFSPG